MDPTIFLRLLTSLIITITTALPPAQNATTPSTTTYNTTTSSLTEDRCFSYVPQPTAMFCDCIGIINALIAPYPDHTTTLTFSRSSSLHPDIKVHYVRYAESWAIVLDVADKQGSEHTTMGDMIEQAKRLAVDCVIGAAHQGGEVHIGWGKKLRLAVLERSAAGDGVEAWVEMVVGKVAGQ